MPERSLPGASKGVQMPRIENLTKAYDDKLVLDGFSAQLPDAGFVAISGKSGAGKTTLLNIMMGLEKADSGSVIWPDGLTPVFSAVFQEDRLLPDMSARDNIIFVLKEDKESAALNAEKLLTDLGLGDDIDTKAKELSGGMARRVAIARALAFPANVYIMDEPIKGLDADTRQQTLDVIRRETAGKLLIMVSHNPEDSEGADMLLEM